MGNTGHLGNEVHFHETILLAPLHLIQKYVVCSIDENSSCERFHLVTLLHQQISFSLVRHR